MSTSVAEFERWLRLGLGRAVRHLEQHDPAPYHTAILHACCHDLTYDRQAEGIRGQYCRDLIQHSAAPLALRDQLLAALATTREPNDISQLLSVIGALARDGDPSARQHLYATFDRNAASDLPDGASEIVALDGLPGLLHVAARIALEPEDDWYARLLVDDLAETLGRATVESALAAAAITDARVAAFLELARAPDSSAPTSSAAASQASSSADDQADYAALRAALLNNEPESRRRLMRWGHHATETEWHQAASDLLSETDVEHLDAYLFLFAHRSRPFPLDPSHLAPYVWHSNRRVNHQASASLARLTHPTVRQLAEELLMAGHGRGAKLLVANHRPDDYAWLERLLQTWSAPDELHELGFALVDLARAHPAPAAVLALLAAYETNPCSFCREFVVKRLIALDGAPPWLLSECRYDANLDLRALVAQPSSSEDSQSEE